jgi:hypothetical protein
MRGGPSGSVCRYRSQITLGCIGKEPVCARDIVEEFTHRPWHENVTCSWDGGTLILQAENDYDEKGLALLDEFSDAIAACIKVPQNTGTIRVLQITTF